MRSWILASAPLQVLEQQRLADAQHLAIDLVDPLAALVLDV
jgi:hypothetical protein